MPRDAPPDVAFLDIEMRGMNGLVLAEQLKTIKPKTNIIFVTGYSEHMGDAFKLLASGYLMKPVTPQDIMEQMENLRYPIGKAANPKRVRAQCFGNFEVFLDGEPVQFA